jgi:hypothetical protein
MITLTEFLMAEAEEEAIRLQNCIDNDLEDIPDQSIQPCRFCWAECETGNTECPECIKSQVSLQCEGWDTVPNGYPN